MSFLASNIRVLVPDAPYLTPGGAGGKCLYSCIHNEISKRDSVYLALNY